MDALQCYGSSSDSDVEDETEGRDLRAKRFKSAPDSTSECSSGSSLSLPPPPPELFKSVPNAVTKKWTAFEYGGRVRSFPHVEGNYALHVYIPVALSASVQTKIFPYLKKAVSLFPGLKSMADDDLSANVRSKQGMELATEFHISLGRTVPIRIHQVDTMVHMLRRKFEGQKGSGLSSAAGKFSSMTIGQGLSCLLKLWQQDIQRSRGKCPWWIMFTDSTAYPPFTRDLCCMHQNPRPHISLAWALGDVMDALATVARELNAMVRLGEEEICLWTSQATKVECKIGQKLYPIWTASV